MTRLRHVVVVLAGTGWLACEARREDTARQHAAPAEAGAHARPDDHGRDARIDPATPAAAERRGPQTSPPARPPAQPSVVTSMIRIRSDHGLRTTVNRMRDELREHDLEAASAGTIDGKIPMHMFVVKPPREQWPTLAKAPQRALQLSTLVMVYEAEPGIATLAFVDSDGRRYAAPTAEVQAQGPGATPLTETQIHTRNVRMALERAAGERETSPAAVH